MGWPSCLGVRLASTGNFASATRSLCPRGLGWKKTVDVFEVGNQRFPGDAFLVIGSTKKPGSGPGWRSFGQALCRDVDRYAYAIPSLAEPESVWVCVRREADVAPWMQLITSG